MKLFRSLFLQFLFWMIFFAIQRAIFLIYYWKTIGFEQIPFAEVLQTFTSAIKLDIATASLILIVPFILLVIQSFFNGKWISKVNCIYVSTILLIYLLISSGELGLYAEWKSKLSYKALVYLRNPSEVFNSISTFNFVLLSLLVVVQFFLFLFIYKKYFYPAKQNFTNGSLVPKILFAAIIPVVLFVGGRGGVGQIPITASQSYFSSHNILNLAAVNNIYNLSFNLIDYYYVEQQNHFTFMPDDEAYQIVQKLHEIEKDTTINVLNTERPNIVIIFLESWSGDLIESLGGLPGLTPEFHQLEKEGLLFTEFYATGNRSQEALASVFSGLPAIPITTLTDNTQKYNSLPSLVKDMKDNGYYSSFFFGGDLNYGNIRSYLVHNGFDKLVDERDFGTDLPKGKLGIHDEGLFDKMLQDIGKQDQPFFTAALTLSSHSPYDQPGERPIRDIEMENDFVNSAWYTDKCLGEFFDEAKQQPWYDNTLFIVLSDHSHPSYNNYQWWSFNYRHIPLLFLGGALSDEFKNTTSNHLATNIDLPATILQQLKLDDESYFWSKNILNPFAPQFAYLELSDGFGWKKPDQYLEYNIIEPLVLGTNIPKDQVDTFKKEGEAYVQVLLKEFLNY